MVPLLLVLSLLAADEPTPKIPVGKETTYVTGPLTKEGYIDYEAALNERLSKGITPERNANVLLWKAFGPRPEGGDRMAPDYFKWLGCDEPPEKGDYFTDDAAYLLAQLKDDQEQRTKLQADWQHFSGRPWAAQDHPRLAAWLEVNAQPLAVVVAASKRPDYYNPLVAKGEKKPGNLINVLLPSVQKTRALAFALRARAMLRTQEGKYAEAWQDLLACHRLGRLVARGGTLIELLVGIAIDAVASNAEVAFLERAGVDAKTVRGYLADLQGLPALPAFADKIDLAERFTYLDCVQLVRRGGLPALGTLTGEKGGPVLPESGLTAAACEPALRNGNRLYDRVVALARNPDRAARAREWRKVYQELAALRAGQGQSDLLKAFSGVPAEKIVAQKISDVMVGLFIPSVERVGDASDRCAQTQRNLHLAFALVAYQREKGKYPERLAELAPLNGTDLFSGKPLIYRPGERGFLLYSVGVNGQDEGGRWYDDEPRGDDPGVRLPLPPLKPRE